MTLDPEEPAKVAEMVEMLGLKHVVITCVARDDLSDGGAGHFAQVIAEIRKRSRATRAPTIEVLTTDFGLSELSMETVCHAKPDVFNHNLETVERLSQGASSGRLSQVVGILETHQGPRSLDHH